MLKHGRDGNFELEVGAYRKVFQACIKAVGEEYIIVMLTYATTLTNPSVGEKVFYFIEQVLTDKKDIIMTYGQKLRNEGMQLGKQQGVQQEKLGIAKNMLTKGYALHEVGELTGLSRETIHRL